MKRNEKGQFIKGHTGNAKGRPKRKTEDKYLKALRDSVTLKDWKAISKKATEQAKRGDRAARQWLSDYLLGKPQQYVDFTSGGDKLPGVMVYLPEIDEGMEAESGETGEVSS